MSEFNKPTNPPAFPSDAVKDPFDRSGMSLRDYMAAKAMQATVSAWDSQGQDRAACVASIIAEESYELADAMLIAREA
jgi:hypothetical protein